MRRHFSPVKVCARPMRLGSRGRSSRIRHKGILKNPLSTPEPLGLICNQISVYWSWGTRIVSAKAAKAAKVANQKRIQCKFLPALELGRSKLQRETRNILKLYCKGKTKNSDEPQHWQRGWTFKFPWVCNSLIFLQMNELPIQTLRLI